MKNNPGLKEFLIRLGTTVIAVVLVMYLAKVWFVDPRLAVLSVEEEAPKPVVKETKPVPKPQPLALPSGVISWKDAAKHYGEHGTVEGKIVATKNTGKVCFLNFDPDWKTTFTAVIFAKRFSAFPPNPENYYLNKRVRVTGYIKEYRGRGGKYAPKPEIICESPSQIEIVKGGAPVTHVSASKPQPPASKVISWKDAAKHYGEHTTVEGTIVDIYNSGKVAKLNFDPDWKHTFSAVIFAKQFSKFPGSPNPENHYYGKKVRVTGRIKKYKGSPQIILEDPSQIKTSWKRTPVTFTSIAPGKLVIKKVDTDDDGIPDTFILTGEPEKKPVSLAKAKAKKPDLIEQPYLIKATCVMIYDGDSIQVQLDDKSIRKVRLVGIDTPEVWRKTGTGWAEDPEPGAKKASKFTKKEVPVGQAIYLDVDDEEPEDHYGRMLALVYTNLSDAKKGPRYSLNAKLLQKGLAEVLFIPPSEFDPYSWK